jgi:hypothetical protein
LQFRRDDGDDAVRQYETQLPHAFQTIGLEVVEIDHHGAGRVSRYLLDRQALEVLWAVEAATSEDFFEEAFRAEVGSQGSRIS